MNYRILLIAAAWTSVAFGAELPDPNAGVDPAPSTHTGTARDLLHDVHLGAGLGATWRTQITGKLAPVTATWDDNRWEMLLAYFGDQKITGILYQGNMAHEGLAPPMWAFAVSRRFNFVDRHRFQAFAGLGAAFLNTTPCGNSNAANNHTPVHDYAEYVYHGCDKLNGSKLNYSLQVGMRFYDRNRDHALDVALRHFSNAGMTYGNRGEDFVTAILVF